MKYRNQSIDETKAFSHTLIKGLGPLDKNKPLQSLNISGTTTFLASGQPSQIDTDPRLTLISKSIDVKTELYLTFEGQVDLVCHGSGIEVFYGTTKILDGFCASASSIHTFFAAELDDLSRLPASVMALNPNLRKNTIVIVIEPTETCVQITFKSKNFHYTDRNLLRSTEPWRRYSKYVGLNYLFSPASTEAGSKYLVVGFSAVNQRGIFGYNYRSVSETTGANAIYLLDDFGDQGAYYLTNNRALHIYETVQSLIHELASDLQVQLSNIILIGSSKGATAALIHGLGIGDGNVFIGAPQTKIGNFLSKAHPNILEYMTGNTSQDDIDYLNDYLYNEYTKVHKSPEVTIVVGQSDHHYKGHVIPLQKHLENTNHRLTLEVLPGTPHHEIGKAYRSRLLDFLDKLIK